MNRLIEVNPNFHSMMFSFSTSETERRGHLFSLECHQSEHNDNRRTPPEGV